MATRMIKLVPEIFHAKAKVALGYTDMKDHLGYPLKLSYTVVFVCVAGRAEVSVDFKDYVIHPNDILVLADDSIASFSVVSSDFQLFYCLMEKSFAPEVAYNLPNQLFLYLHHAPHYVPKNEEIELLRMWIVQANHIMDRCFTYQTTMMRNHLQNLFLHIAEMTAHINPIEEFKFSRRELLCWKFWNLVGKHCQQHRDVAFYANQLNITPYYLSQITKDFLNDAPKDLINRQVLLEIKSLLVSTEMSIKEIAEELHFNDPSYLCRYFKRQTGVSLSQYR